MANRPAISVIIPVYNAGDYVETCIDSCLAQTLRDIEVVCVDDGSTDDSWEVVQRACARDGRVRAYRQENAGAAVARNLALDHATGEFAFFIDSDDYVPETTAFERLYAAARAGGVAIAGGSMCIDRDGKVDFESLHGSALDSFSEEAVVEYADYQYDYDFTRYIYSIDMLREHGIRFPELCQFEDPVFFVRAMIAAERFATIPDAVYAYRYGPQARRHWTKQMVLDRARGIAEILRVSKELGYAQLHAHVTGQLDGEMLSAWLENVGDDEVLHTMSATCGLVDCALLKQVDPNAPDFYVLDAWRYMGRAYLRQLRLKQSPIGRALVGTKHLLDRAH